jgi:hypothetical protein
MAIRRVIDAIGCGYVFDEEWIDSFKAADIVAVFLGFRSTLMVRVNTAYGTKVMLCGMGIELIQRQNVLPLDNFQTGQWHGCSDSALSAANRAIATAWIDDAIR